MLSVWLFASHMSMVLAKDQTWKLMVSFVFKYYHVGIVLFLFSFHLTW